MVLALLLLSLVPSTEHVNTRVHLTYPTSHLRHYYTDLDGKHHSYSVHGRLPGPHVPYNAPPPLLYLLSAPRPPYQPYTTHTHTYITKMKTYLSCARASIRLNSGTILRIERMLHMTTADASSSIPGDCD